MHRRADAARWLPFLAALSLPLAACGVGGPGGSVSSTGLTQRQTIRRLSPHERVLFRSEDTMIVEDRRTGRTETLRFRDGRLDTRFAD